MELFSRIGLEHPSLRKHARNPFPNLVLRGLLHALITLPSYLPNPLVFSMESGKLCGVKSIQTVHIPVGKSMRCSVRARLTYAYKALRSQPVDFTTASRFRSWAVAVPDAAACLMAV